MSLTVADRVDIGQLSQRYAWALDHGDYEKFANCFVVNDGCVEIGSGQGDSSGVERYEGRVRLREFARKHYESTKLQLKHIICSELIEEVSPGLVSYRAQFICFRPGAYPRVGILMTGEYDTRRPIPDDSRPPQYSASPLVSHLDAVASVLDRTAA